MIDACSKKGRVIPVQYNTEALGANENDLLHTRKIIITIPDNVSGNGSNGTHYKINYPWL